MSKVLVNALYQSMFMRQLDMRKKMGPRQYRYLFPEKYKIWLGDAQVDLEGVDNSVYTQLNTLLLKEPGL